MLNVERILAGPYEENAYLCWLEGRDEAFIVDPGGRADALMAELERRSLHLTHILLTHGHFDHILAVPELRRRTGAVIWIHERDEGMLFDPYPLKLPGPVQAVFEPLKLAAEQRHEGDELLFAGTLPIRMIDTPGHTPGGACFSVPDEQLMFTGDTLFRDGYGRTDFATSRAADLRASLQRLFQMPDDIWIYPGHGEGDALGAVKRRFGR